MLVRCTKLGLTARLRVLRREAIRTSEPHFTGCRTSGLCEPSHTVCVCVRFWGEHLRLASRVYHATCFYTENINYSGSTTPNVPHMMYDLFCCCCSTYIYSSCVSWLAILQLQRNICASLGRQKCVYVMSQLLHGMWAHPSQTDVLTCEFTTVIAVCSPLAPARPRTNFEAAGPKCGRWCPGLNWFERKRDDHLCKHQQTMVLVRVNPLRKLFRPCMFGRHLWLNFGRNP